MKIHKKEHNGITFTMYELPAGRGECAHDKNKFHLDGRTSITIADNQYKYGDEVIIQVYAQKGTTVQRERVNENYDRIQIFFKKSEFLELLKEINRD